MQQTSLTSPQDEPETPWLLTTKGNIILLLINRATMTKKKGKSDHSPLDG